MTNETISVKIAKKIEKFSIAFSDFQSWGSGGQLRPASTESMFFSTYNLVSYTCNLFSSQQTVIFQDVSDEVLIFELTRVHPHECLFKRQTKFIKASTTYYIHTL